MTRNRMEVWDLNYVTVIMSEATKLRQRNRDLQENLELAIAAIQRLTLDNHRLRQKLEAARAVTPIRPRRRIGSTQAR
jgi:hypothetical protein